MSCGYENVMLRSLDSLRFLLFVGWTYVCGHGQNNNHHHPFPPHVTNSTYPTILRVPSFVLPESMMPNRQIPIVTRSDRKSQ